MKRAIVSFALFLLPLSVLLAQGGSAAGMAGGSGSKRSGVKGDYPYSIVLEPERPVDGSPFRLGLRVEGLSGLELASCKTGKGLSLSGSLGRPWRNPVTGAGGGELWLEFAVSGRGPWTIDSLEVAGAEGRFGLGPLRIEASQPGPASAGGMGSPPSLSWAAPERVYRYASFSARIVAAGGEMPAAAGSPGFEVPSGIAIEGLPSDPFAWTVTALNAGSLVLPQARVEVGKLSLRIPPRRVEILPLPPEVESSRAQGSFSLGLEAPGLSASGPARSGDVLVFRLVLRGRGNLPSVIFPKPVLSLDGRRLRPESYSGRRIDRLEAVEGGYEGSSTLEISLAAPGPGTLRLAFPELPVLTAEGDIEKLSVEPIGIAVRKALPAPESKLPDELFAKLKPGFAARLAKASQGLARLPRLVAAGKAGPALELLDAAPPALAESRDARLLKASLLWASGSRGEALSVLYGISRASPADREAAELSSAAAKALGTGPALGDDLPPPRPFIAIALGLAAAALGLGLLSLRRPGSRRSWLPGRWKAGREPRGEASKALPLRAAAVFALVLALGSGGLGLASSLERRTSYAVAWTDRAYAVPSPLSEGSSVLVKGATGRVVGRTEGYVCLKFEDGSIGWAPRDSVYFY
jgi:hypothetical protein